VHREDPAIECEEFGGTEQLDHVDEPGKDDNSHHHSGEVLSLEDFSNPGSAGSGMLNEIPR